MKKLIAFSKKILIIYLIFYIALSSMTSCFARKYDDKCGEYVSQYARDFIEKYCTPASKTHYDASTIYPHWSQGEFKGDFYACCTTGVYYMYKNALGVDIYELDYSAMSDTAISQMSSSNNWIQITSAADLKPGDIVINNHHTEMYIGNGENANFGNDPNSGKIAGGPRYGSDFTHAFRPNFDVNPTGTVPIEEGEIEEENLSIYDENGFIYSGVAKIEGYKNSAPLGKWIISMLTEILDYLLGILTLSVRIVIVGWTAIIEGWISDLVNAITGVNNERVDDWGKDPEEFDEIDEEAAEENQENRQESQATGSMGDPDYISEGVQAIADMGGSIQLNKTQEAKVTVENMVYNKIPILDVNFFNFESAGGAVVNEDGIVYIIKENVAMWYYIFRILAIIVMLVMLLYLGVRMALTTVSEKKAVYKEMLLSWIAAFILVFVVNYIMYFILSANEVFINWIIPRYEDGTEVSLYESVRSKAYEIKFSTGFTGLIMYIILIYYSIRFAIVYFKRFLTIMILALMSPFVAISYGFEKINKKGKGKAEVFGNWLKDFSYTVAIQSMHALIYTVFIGIVLKLTQSSIVGIFLAFMFLNMMIKVDPLLRRIFGFGKGKNATHLSVPPIYAHVKAAKGFAKTVKPIVAKHGNYLGRELNKTASKVGNKIGYARDSINRSIDDITRQTVSKTEYEQMQTKKKAQEQKSKERKEKLAKLGEAAKVGGKVGLNGALAVAKGALVVPIGIVEPQLGIEILSSATKSKDKAVKLIESAKKDKLLPKTLEGVYLYNGLKSNKNKIKTNNKETNNQSKQATDILRTKVNINNMQLAVGNTSIDDVLVNKGMNKATAYADILSKARVKEREIQQQYTQLIGSIDNQISEMNKLNPEFARRLKEKKTIELEKQAKALYDPLTEKDIEKAMESYKNKVPNFKMDGEMLTKADIDGITKEINTVLESKEDSIQLGEQFKERLKEELEKSIKDKKEETTDRHKRSQEENIDDKNNPYSESNRNAPKQNDNSSGESSVEKLVKNIQNASKGTESKTTTTMSKDTIDFAKKLEELEKLSQEASTITGEDLYDLDNIFERLEQL